MTGHEASRFRRLGGSPDCKMLGYDSRMGQWQVSITSLPPSSTLTLCSSWSKDPHCIFLHFPSSSQIGQEGETTQALCPGGMRQCWEERLRKPREGAPDNRGAESCVRGECTGWHGDMKPHCMEYLLAPAMNPLLDPSHIPTMKSDLAEQRVQVNGQEQSNCLSP